MKIKVECSHGYPEGCPIRRERGGPDCSGPVIDLPEGIGVDDLRSLTAAKWNDDFGNTHVQFLTGRRPV